MLDDRHYMRSDYRPPRSMTTILLVAVAAAYIVQIVASQVVKEDVFFDWFALSREGLMHGRVYQLITFQFLHGGVWHLLGNMMGIYFFGRAMEETLGRARLLRLYLMCGTIGGLIQIALGFAFPALFGGIVLGASAGVFGLIAAFAISRPNQPITLLVLLVLPVTFPAKVILAFEAAISVFGILSAPNNIAHAAHLGGMITGIVYMKCFWSDVYGARWHWHWHWPKFFQRRRPHVVTTRIITPPPRTWRAPAPLKVEEIPPAEFMSRKVDPILEKISAHGIQSLTDEERRILEAARDHMARR